MKWSLVLALVFGGIAAAQQPAGAPALDPNVIDEFQWQDLPAAGPLYKAALGDGSTLRVTYTGEGPAQSALRVIGPAIVSRITSSHYAIVGKLKYTNVTAGSYLEMWSYFAPEQPGGPEGAYFSRTLADAGPMAKLEGTDDGRDFSLPFDATGAKTKLVRLMLNIHFAGPTGKIDLSNVRLVQYPNDPQPPANLPPSTVSGNTIVEFVLNVNADGSITLTYFTKDGSSGPFENYPSIAALEPLLKGIRGSSHPPLAVLRAEGDVPYDRIRAVLDACRDAGVQTSLATAHDSPAIPRTARAAQSRNFDVKSFLLGVLTTCLLFVAAAGAKLALARWNQFRHARELRRIASLDT